MSERERSPRAGWAAAGIFGLTLITPALITYAVDAQHDYTQSVTEVAAKPTPEATGKPLPGVQECRFRVRIDGLVRIERAIESVTGRPADAPDLVNDQGFPVTEDMRHSIGDGAAAAAELGDSYVFNLSPVDCQQVRVAIEPVPIPPTADGKTPPLAPTTLSI